ncbi:MAG: glycosyltransferase [Planctomycetota bacterium]
MAVVYPGSQVRYDCMVRQVRALREDECAGIATPRIMEADYPQILRRMGMAIRSSFEPFPLGAFRYATLDCCKPSYVPAASGACMMVRKEVFKKIGRFDENYMLCWEDVEFSFRATVNGFRCLYEPDAVVYESNTSIMDPWSRLNVYHRCRGTLPTAMKYLPDETLIQQCNDLLLKHMKNAFIYYGCGGRLITALKGKWAGFQLAREIYKKRKAGIIDEAEETKKNESQAEKTPERLKEEQKARDKKKKKKADLLERNLLRGDRLWKASRDSGDRFHLETKR